MFRRQRRAMAEKTVICPSCGAHFAASSPRCPYCGTIYVPAAERDYMDKLGDVRESLEEVGDAGVTASRHEAKRTGRLVLRVLLAVAVIAAVIGGVAAWKAAKEKRDVRAEYRWQREHFPEMDALYEAGEYDRLLELYNEALDEDHDMWQWPHYAFCEIYGSYRYGEETLEFVTNEPSQEEKYREDLLWCYLSMRGAAYRYRMPSEDRRKTEEMTEDLQRRIAEHLGLSDEDIEMFDGQLKKSDGYPHFDDIKAFFGG